jgi:hypothetical protein
MRTALILPLALAAVAAAGCGTASDGTQQTAFRVPQRDLTLRQGEAPEVEVASPIELARAPVQARSVHQPRQTRRAARASRPETIHPAAAAAVSAPAPAPTRVEPISLAAPASEAPDPHALAPGKTVTMIPVSSGPSTAPEGNDPLPPEGGRGTAIHTGGHGGGCRPGGIGGHPGGGGFRGLR